ncbi:MAG: cell wall hydrolase [Peptococcaceae bacterium]|nr:cell wall hydrolase [Peptococcaceae bacterium]
MLGKPLLAAARDQAADSGGAQEEAAVKSLHTGKTRETTLQGAKLSPADVLILARVIEGEAGGEPFKGKVAVGAVIINRVEDERFPDSIYKVTHQPGAFYAVRKGTIRHPISEDALRAAKEAIKGVDPTGGALYFWNPAKATSSWIHNRHVITRIGNHVFAI